MQLHRFRVMVYILISLEGIPQYSAQRQDTASTNISLGYQMMHLVDNKTEGKLHFHPYARTGSDKNICILNVTQESINSFVHEILLHDLCFVFLNLQFTDDLVVSGIPDVVDEHVWVWTYPGKKGGQEFLSWPLHFGIWSMGILYSYIGEPINIKIYNTSGNCADLQVGDNLTDVTISAALIHLIDAIESTKHGEMLKSYEHGFFCYKERMILKSEFRYNMCKYIICPLETMRYSCRSYVHGLEYTNVSITNAKIYFNHDSLWWEGPIVLAVLLFTFSPILILAWANKCSIGIVDEYIFQDGSDQITISNVILSPLLSVCRNNKYHSRQLLLFSLPCLSLSVVGLQMFLDYCFVYDVYIKSIKKGVLMGLESMLAGFIESEHNFLPHLGGPYIACICYVTIACLLLLVPKSISSTLEIGTNICSSGIPLNLNIHVQERFGSNLIQNKHGFIRVTNMLHARFNCVINSQFWKFVINLQIVRWRKFHTSKLRLFMLPVLICVCIFENILCLLVYGSPAIGFALIVFRSYRVFLRQYTTPRLCRPLIWVADFYLLISIAFVFFMLTNIFLDACTFFSRLCIFTYTGVIVYPKLAYGYLILVITILYYMREYSCKFTAYFNNLLNSIIQVCESVEAENDSENLVFIKLNCKGLKASLFYNVIDMYSPIRKRILVSLLCLSITIYILGMSVHLIMQRE